MKLPEYSVRIILFLMFLVAAGARFSTTSGSLYPYFRGESAMNYRDALTVADTENRRNLDQPTIKSNWPEGYRPARIRPTGFEYIAGVGMKIANWFSDADTRDTAKRMVIFFFCLSVFTLYAITRNLWRSQVAGFLAAAFVAFFPPLVEATNGQVLGHTPAAMVLVTFHLLALGRYARGSTWSGIAGSAVFTFLLLATWEIAPYYIAACSLIATLFYPLRSRQRLTLAIVHLAVFIAASVMLPHARALRLAFSWQAAAIAACFVQTLFTARFPGVRRGGIFIVAASVILVLVLSPFRSGADIDLPAMKYVFYRLRFLFARPDVPSLVPETIRHLWTADHAPPGAHALIVFILPLLFGIPAAVVAARDLLRKPGEIATPRARVILVTAVAVFGCFVFFADRNAIAVASLATAPFLALAGCSLEHRPKLCGALVAAVSLVVSLQLFWPTGKANPAFQLSKLFGVTHRDKSQILWASLENTDIELVRFVATRTSTRDPFLGRPDHTAILLTFCGRTSVLLSGGRSSGHAGKNVEMTRLMYGHEAPLYDRCSELGVKYVLYSVDYVLDTTQYSPLFLAGLPVVPQGCVALSMHFAPEALRHFNLVYENDRYRLFKVTEKPEPIFATDHPIIYQREILELNSDTYESFRNRINRLLISYTDAQRAAAAGRLDVALHDLAWCLRQAPHFTRARVAAGSILLDNGQAEEAQKTLMAVLQYTPDDQWALYYIASAMNQLGDTDGALNILKIFYQTVNDPELLSRGRLLETIIKKGTALPTAPDAR